MRRAWLLVLSILLAINSANAAPGDTTWVQANNVQLNYYNNFDSAVVFPNGGTSYRKIYMIFTLGMYNCGSAQYCHQWDYTVQNYLMTPAGDTVEISRFITPYGTSGTPRFPTGWSFPYVWDVTDYAPLLKNNATIRIHYSGYSGGFTANVKFAFIEGTPERNVIGVAKLWDGSYDYGRASDPIDNHITAKTKTAPAGTQAAELKFNITGHGSDATDQCCEFSKHSYHVLLNGNTVDQREIWRDDCGANELYAQGGTWIYERANWCPGSLVEVNSHKLPGVTAGSSYNVDVDFDPYTNSPTSGNGGYGSYTIQGNVIYYGAVNRTLNAALEDIIAPSTSDWHFRENPSSDMPIIKIRNTSSTPITSVTLLYGVKDSVLQQYTWNGTLGSLKDTIITLPAVGALRNLSLGSASGLYKFIAQVTAVNGVADNDHTDDTLRSSFIIAPTWTQTIQIVMKTNNEGVTGLNQGPSETSWKVTDMNGNIIAQRQNAAINTLYTDTVFFRNTGFYKLTIDDAGCDGLHWWPYDQQGSPVTAGYFRVLDADGIPNPMHGYYYGGQFNNDFGCTYSQYFTVTGWPTAIGNVPGNSLRMRAYPNPAATSLEVNVEGSAGVHGTLQLFNMIGQEVASQPCNGNASLDVHSLSNGAYQLVYTGSSGERLIKRINISH